MCDVPKEIADLPEVECMKLLSREHRTFTLECKRKKIFKLAREYRELLHTHFSMCKRERIDDLAFGPAVYRDCELFEMAKRLNSDRT